MGSPRQVDAALDGCLSTQWKPHGRKRSMIEERAQKIGMFAEWSGGENGSSPNGR
jgi:hypothetical protein